MTCEKCWGDAYMKHLSTGRSQYACYLDIKAKRDRENQQYTPQEQAGQFWDEEKQVDRRAYFEKKTDRG